MSAVLTAAGETRVNTFTANSQEQPAITALAGGGYVVTWMSASQDGSGYGVYAQRYGADGTPLGGEVRVNTFTTSDQYLPAITALADGGYVVTWMSASQDAPGWGIYAQRYGADGTALGGEVRVNTTTVDSQMYPAITALGAGYVVTWTSFNQDGSGWGIYAQRYGADGSALGGEVRVNTTTANSQEQPAITALAGGGYVVTWMSASQDGSGYGIYAQRYGADGTALGGEVRVNSTTDSDQMYPTITALADGGYVVTWMSWNQDGSGYGIYAQRYGADGTALGGEVRVNTTTADNQYFPVITALIGGGYVVTWMSSIQDGSSWGIYAQRYGADGTALGGEVRVNTTTANSQEQPAITALADGGFAVTWMSFNQDGSSYGVYSRTFASSDFTSFTSAVEFVTGTPEDDTYTVSDPAFLVGDDLEGSGGTDILQLTAGVSLDLTAMSGLSGVERIVGGAGDEVLVVSDARLAEVSSIDLQTGTDTLRAGEMTLDLRGKTLTGVERIVAGRTEGLTLTVDNFATALLMDAADRNITIIDATQAFTATQRQQLFDKGVESVVQGSRAYYADGTVLVEGLEVRANTTTASDQMYPDITALADGGYVVTWMSSIQDGSSWGIYAQHYGADGTALGGEVRVNTTTASEQMYPAITALAGGGYVVTWMSSGQDGSGYGVYAQRYGADGGTLGGEVRVNTFTTSDQYFPATTALAGGGYVVTWMSVNQDGSGWGIYAQCYGADGSALGGEVRVNTTAANSQERPAITALADGGFAVTWMSVDQDGSGWGIYAQRYGAEGTPLGGELRVNTTTFSNQMFPAITALAGGGYVVTWMSSGQDGSGYGIYAKRYGADGAALGGEIRVNSTTASDQANPAITALAGGGYVVTWMSINQDGSAYGIYAQRYGADGTPLGGELRINTTTANSQEQPAITALADGGFVVTWMSLNQDGSGWGIYNKVFSGTLANQAPVADAGGPYAIDEGEAVLLNAGASYDPDNDDTIVSYEWDLTGDGAFDATSATPELTLSAAQIEAIGLNPGTYTILVRVTDSTGSTHDDTASLTIANVNDAPVVVSGIADQSTAEDAPYSYDAAQHFADDDLAYGDSLTYSASGLPAWLSIDVVTGQLTGTPENGDVGAYAITVTATDDAGASISSSFTLTVDNVNDAPVVSIELADQTASEDEPFTFAVPENAFTDADGDTLTYTATLANGDPLPAWLAFDPMARTFSGTPAQTDAGTLSITVTASDGTATVSDTFDLAVGATNDTPVVVSEIADAATAEDAGYSYDASIHFSDPDGDALTYSATGLPNWLTLDTATGMLSGTPANADVGPYTITITASDAQGSASSEFVLTVTNTNDAPVVATEIADQSTNEDAPYSYNAAQHFADDDLIHADSLTYSATGLPAWLSIDAATGLITGTPANADVGSYTITVTASDGEASASSTFALAVDNVNDEPVLVTALADQAASEDEPFAFTIPEDSFSDGDGDTLTYTASLANGDPLPAWLAFDQLTRTFSGTPSQADAGTLSITVTASDGTTSASDTFDLTVGGTNDAPEVVSPIVDTSAAEDAIYSYDASTHFSDPDGDSLAYTVTGPSWLSIDAATGILFGTPTNGDVGEYQVTVMAEDPSGAEISISYTVTVNNTNDAPVVTTEIADQSTEEDAPYSYDAAQHFADDDLIHGDSLTYSASGLPAWLSIDAATGQITGTPANEDVGAYTITVTASDGEASASSTFALSVGGTNDAPVVSIELADQAASEDAPFSFTVPEDAFTDADGDALTYTATLANGDPLPAWLAFDPMTRTFSGTPSQADTGTISITVTASDGTGSVSDTFVLDVGATNDTPVLVSEIADAATAEDAGYSYDASIHFSDPDGDALTYSATGLPNWLTLDTATGMLSGTPANADVGPYTITVTASDAQGSASSEFVLTVTNTNDAPVVATEIADQSTNEDAPYSYNAAQHFADADVIHGDALTYSAAGLPAWLSIDAATGQITGTPAQADVGSYTITVIASDGEASASSTFALTVNDVPDETVTATVTFRDGLGGYAGTIDTMIRQNAPGAGAGAATTLRVDADANAEYQTLLAFTNLFGTGPGQIPPGAIITS
ncbi:putative Ig domain-containing protein, partial [Microvirga lupini]